MEIYGKCMECLRWMDVVDKNLYYDVHAMSCPRYYEVGMLRDWQPSPYINTSYDAAELMYTILSQQWMKDEED